MSIKWFPTIYSLSHFRVVHWVWFRYTLRAVGFFYAKREKPWRATVCFSIEHARFRHAPRVDVMHLMSISSPEPTCLLVSTKTQSSGIINFQRPISILGVPVSRRMRALVYMASRDKVDVDTFHIGIQYTLGKLGKPKFAFERTTVSNFKSKRHEGSGNEIVDYSRAPCLGADQKGRGLLERD